MKLRSFLRYLDLRWFRGMKLRPTRPIQKQLQPLHLETLETRIVPSNVPTIIKTLTTPADGSSVSTATPTIQVVFSEEMNAGPASNTGNYFLFGSAGNSIPITSVTLTGPDSSGHETATLNYSGSLILDTYTLFVAGNQLTEGVDGQNLPLAQPGQYVVANGGTSNVSIVSMPGNGTLGSAAGYSLPGLGTTTPTPIAAVAGVLTGTGGLPDLVVVDSANSQVDIYAGQPEASGGGFDLTPDLILTLPTGSANTKNSVTLGDFNGDGNLDIAVANAGTDNVTVFLNTTTSGNLSFGAGINYTGTGVAALTGPSAIVAGDFDGATTASGTPIEDLAVLNNTVDANDNYNLVILQGDGSGSFGTPIPANSQFVLGNSTAGTGLQGLTSLASGQFAKNKNNLPDLVAAGTGGAVVLLNQTTGIGNFVFNQQALTSITLNDVAAGVVRATSGSGTQLDDIVGLDAVNNQVDIWQNANSSSIGIASFTFMSTSSFGSNATGLALAPLIAGNSQLDILVTQNNKAGSLSVLMNNSTIGSTTFSAPVTYTVDNNPVAVVAADFSGATDASSNPIDQVVTVNNTDADVTLLQGAGDGTLNTATNTALVATTAAVAVGDLNGDGIPDLIVAQNTPATGGFHGSSGSTSITVMLGSLNNGVVTYGADSFTYTAANSGLGVKNIVSIAVGDIYGGKFNDIVVLDQTDSVVEVLKNNLSSSSAALGAGSFTPEATIAVGNTPTQLVLADLNNATDASGTPILDLVVAHEGSGGFGHGFGGNPGGVSILMGNGNGTFGKDTEYDANNTAVAVAVADFNNDGNLDFVVANTNNNGTIEVYYGNGNGSFTSPSGAISAGVTSPSALAVGDLTGDGFDDIIVASNSTGATSGGVAVFLNQLGTGFGSPIVTQVLPGTALESVVVANVNEDAFPDLIVTTQPGTGGSTTDNIFTLLGNGDGTFQRAVPYNAGGTSSPTVAPSYSALVSDPFLRVTTFHSGGTTVEPNLIDNGTFSTTDLVGVKGSLTGWQQYELPDNPGGSNGTWGIQTGTTSPLSGTSVTPPSGAFQAMLDEANITPYSGNNNPNPASSYSGSTALYQDVTIPTGSISISLSMTLDLYNFSDDTTTANPQGWGDNTTNGPQILNYNTSTLGGAFNQQVRVDLMDPSNIDSITGVNNTNGLGITTSTGLLANLFMTTAGDDFTNPVKITVSPSGVITVNGVVASNTVNWSLYAGKTIMLRIATTNNAGQLLVGVQSVQIDALFPDTTPPTISGLALRNPGYTDPTTGTVDHTTDPTIVGILSDIGGLNSPAGFKQGNVAYIEFDLSNDSFSGASGDVVDKITSWDSAGNFTFTVPNPVPGLNTLDVAAVDEAGNVSVIQVFTFYYQGPSLTDWQAYGPTAIDVVGQSGVNYTTVSGDVTAVAVDPSDPSGNTYYVGSDNGGVWKTTDGGNDYTPLTDYVTNNAGQPIPVPVGAIAVSKTVDPATNTHIVYVGTGVANLDPDSMGGFGVLVSTDGGATWTVDGNSGTVLAGATISSVVVDNDNPNIVYVAVASGGAAGPGVYMTTNALGSSNTTVNTSVATWKNVTTGNVMFLPNSTSTLGAGIVMQSVTSLIEDPFNTDRLIMGVGNIGMSPTGAQTTEGVWLSINQGQSWTLEAGGANGIANSSLPNGDATAFAPLGRVTVAMGTGRVGDEANVYVLIGTPPTNTTAPNFDYGSEYSSGANGSGLYYSPNNMLDFTEVMLKVNTPNAVVGYHNFQSINLLGNNASNAGALLVDPTDPDVVYVGGSTEGITNPGVDQSLEDQSFIRVDVGNIDGISGTNTGDDASKLAQSIKQGGFYNPVTDVDPYEGEGVYWYNLAGATSGTTGKVQLLPPDITSLAFDAQGRLIIGTNQGVWRGVSEGFGYDFTSGGQGILAKRGPGGGQTFSAPGMELTAINGNLQISDLTSVAIDPSLRGVLYTTQYNTGTAASSTVLQWTSEDLTGPTVNGTDLGITNAGDILISTPPVGAPADTPNTLYRVWEYAATGALVPEVSDDDGETWDSLASTGIPTTGLSAGDFPAFVIDPVQILDSGIYESVLLLGTSNSTGDGEIYITKTSSNVWDALPPVPLAGGTISALAIAPSNDQVFYVGTTLGQVFTTTDSGGDGWPLVDTGLPANTPVTSITVDPNTAATAYVTFGGSGASHVFMTINSGATWVNITSNLPAVSANSLVIVPVTVDDVTTDDLYVATNVGVYMTTNLGQSWSRVGVGMPNVPVVNLQYSASFGTIAAATQGRGVYTLSTNTDGAHVTAVANGSSSTTINSIDVTFNEPVNPSTFTPSVITLTGPNGSPIAVTGITDIDSGQDEEFAVSFAAQSASGLYTITFGPNVLDQTGNQMDQNQNGINGENPGDVFTGQVYFFTGATVAPVLGNTAATFPAAGEDDLGTNTGTAVLSSWVTSTLDITEANSSLQGVQGIAITGVDDSTGTWEYSLNGGTTWTDVPTGVDTNAVSETNALLLEASANDELRYVPGTAYDSQTIPPSGVLGSATFTYRAWNLTSGLSPTGNDGTFADVSTADNANGGTTAFSSAEGTATVAVTYVNHAPTFTGGSTQTVLENAAAQTVAGWATNLVAGPPNEAGQTLSFVTTNNNNSLFAMQPTVSSTGTLTYQVALNTNGSATVTVELQDNGGTANGGQNTSQPYTFTINVTAVNQPPTFTGGPNQAETVFGAVETVTNWATNISPGAGNSPSETATFVVTNNDPALFAVQPTVSSNGTLTYQVGSTIGTATVTVFLQNNGGTANGGSNTSAAYSFTITANPVVSSGSANDAWVSDVYRELLGHEITASEIAFWNNAFNTGATRLEVATEIASSSEYDTVFLTGVYEKDLGRAVDSASSALFLPELLSGNQTTTEVQAQVLSSTEYYNRNGGTTFGYLFGLYRDVLGQTMSTAGYNYWSAQIQAGVPLYTVALDFLTSPAGEAVMVQNVYKLMLNRNADSAGIAYWSGLPINTLEAQLAATPEYGLDSTAQYYNSQPDATWLNQVYLEALNRPIDANGLSYFITQIREGVSGPALVDIITTSQEFYTNLVTTEFTNILKRVPDAATVSYFVTLLQQGETNEQVQAVMYGSAEFFNNEGGGTNNGFLSALYLDALNRPLDSTGAAVWGAELLAFPSTYSVAFDVLTSSEAEQDLISAAYLKYLNRPVDSTGLSYWLGQLQGGMTDQEFYAQLLGSLEFYNKYS